MKKIEAIIKPFRLDEVKEALNKLGITGMTISEVKDSAVSADTKRCTGVPSIRSILCPRSRSTLWCHDMADQVVATITQKANTNKVGDGKIFVFPIESAVRSARANREKMPFRYPNARCSFSGWMAAA